MYVVTFNPTLTPTFFVCCFGIYIWITTCCFNTTTWMPYINTICPIAKRTWLLFTKHKTKLNQNHTKLCWIENEKQKKKQKKTQQSCLIHFLKKICHIQRRKSSSVQKLLPSNLYAGFVDTIIKLTSVTWKLFSFTWWFYRGHCMKNSETVWSRWSPGDQEVFQLVLVAETVATVLKQL